MRISLAVSDCISSNLGVQTNDQLSELPNSKLTAASQPVSRLSIDQTINNLLKDLASTIDSRETLLNLLPSNLKTAAIAIISQQLLGTENIPKGLAAIVSAQKNASDNLQKLANIVKDAEFIKSNVPQKIPNLLQETLNTYLSPFFKTEPQLARWLTNNSFSSIDQYIANDPESAKQLIADTLTQELPQQAQSEIKHLITMFSKTAPETLTQLAVKYKLPELITLWSNIKLNNALPWTELEPRQSHEARDTLNKLAASFQNTPSISDETLQDTSTQKTFSMTLPIYFENNPQPYPAYIHVYHEDNNNTGQYDDKTSETWLRICLATENIGIVDAVFRLYQENCINIRVAFSSVSAGDAFSLYLSEIESNFSKKMLRLIDICVK